MKARNIYKNIELLIATIITGFVAFLIATHRSYYEGRHQFNENNIQYDFYANYLKPSLILLLAGYLLFIFLTQYVEIKTKGFLKIILFICTYLLLAVTYSVCLTYIEAWRFGDKEYPTVREVTTSYFADGFAISFLCFFSYLLYYGVKELIFSPVLKMKLKESNGSKLIFIALSILSWLIILMMLAANNAEDFLIVCWAVVLPYTALMIYINVLVLLPKLPEKNPFKSYYLSRIIPITLLLNFIATVFCKTTNSAGMPFIGLYVLLLLWTGAIVIPMAWWIYKNRSEKLGLQTALGSSQANLSFLRSQINPHFLFNALNTLYGTALQEHADRTGEGIQKLGDMMRFMLHENVQDKIVLIREVEYLKNYIDLQNLRVVSSPNIAIQTKIEEPATSLQISPMLLIPFVENAYKHGISLRDPSYITIGLHTQGSTLYFDVQNSIHLKPDGDPEKLKSGIGLQNVTERLQLEYPDRHELVIRQTAKEFFVHLTITL